MEHSNGCCISSLSNHEISTLSCANTHAMYYGNENNTSFWQLMVFYPNNRISTFSFSLSKYSWGEKLMMWKSLFSPNALFLENAKKMPSIILDFQVGVVVSHQEIIIYFEVHKKFSVFIFVTTPFTISFSLAFSQKKGLFSREIEIVF